MNKYINKIFLTSVITLAGMLGATSCTDYLDKSPYSDIEENDPYKNFKNFVVERLIHRNAVIRVICGNFAGMVSVRLTLV